MLLNVRVSAALSILLWRFKDLCLDVWSSQNDHHWTCVVLCSFSTFWPVIAKRIHKQLTVCTEVTSGDRTWEFFWRLVLALCVLVPGEEVSIAADSHKSVELLVECNLVKTVDISGFGAGILKSMAFEGEVRISIQILACKVIVFYTTSTLDRAHCIPFTITKAGNCCCWKLQWGLTYVFRVPVIGSECSAQIPNVDKAVLVSCNQEWEFAAHVMNGHCYVSFTKLLQHGWALPRPKLDSRVPTATYHYRCIVIREDKACYVFHRLLMLTNSLYLIRIQVPFSYVVISAS